MGFQFLPSLAGGSSSGGSAEIPQQQVIYVDDSLSSDTIGKSYQTLADAVAYVNSIGGTAVYKIEILSENITESGISLTRNGVRFAASHKWGCVFAPISFQVNTTHSLLYDNVTFEGLIMTNEVDILVDTEAIFRDCLIQGAAVNMAFTGGDKVYFERCQIKDISGMSFSSAISSLIFRQCYIDGVTGSISFSNTGVTRFEHGDINNCSGGLAVNNIFVMAHSGLWGTDVTLGGGGNALYMIESNYDANTLGGPGSATVTYNGGGVTVYEGSFYSAPITNTGGTPSLLAGYAFP